MALNKLEFSFQGRPGNTIEKIWSHTGVVGSGDLEILLERQEAGGKVLAQVVTPVHGFEYVWERVLDKFVADTGAGDVKISINDNNATPFIVSMRLKQAWLEGKAGERA